MSMKHNIIIMKSLLNMKINPTIDRETVKIRGLYCIINNLIIYSWCYLFAQGQFFKNNITFFI